MRTAFIYIPMLLTGMMCLTGTGFADQNTANIGDNLIQVTLSTENGLHESDFMVGDKEIGGLNGIPWSIEVDGKTITPMSGKTVIVSTKGKGGATASGENELLSWTMTYELTGTGRIMKTLSLTPKKDFVLQRVSMWNMKSTSEPLVSRTPMQDIAAFYRKDDCGLFTSLDFPYSKIVSKDSLTSVTYPPYDQLKAGKEYVCYSLTFGATKLTGKERYGFDDGEVDAMDSYVQERYPHRFNKPMFVTCGMNNRYCQPRDGYIWYTMKDHGTLSFNVDILKREIALTRKMGIEYFQLFPGEFDWVSGDPDPKVIKDVMDFSRSIGMHTGDYSTVAGLFCPHYNEHSKSLSKPEWRLKDQNGNAGGFNLGSKEFVDFYIKNVVATARKYGFEFHNLDSLAITPDFSKTNSYPPGDDSIYQQVKGLVRLIDAIDQVSPEMMTWSNAGNWSDFLPKLAWWNHNLYLTDPYIDKPWPGLNMTRLMDEARRDQMVSLHHSRFMPYRSFTNYQYFFAQNSAVPDIRNYQYGMLSSIAVTPNFGIGDVRPWLDTLPDRQVDEVIAFYRKWTKFLQDNYALWIKTYSVGENPGIGSVEIYGHAKGSRGYVFVVNPQYWDRTVEIPLDESMGFTGKGKAEVAEMNPVERLLLTSQGPFASFGSKITVKVPAQQVLVLKVNPAPAKITSPKMYGLPGTIERSKDGYLVKTSRPQGITERCAVLFSSDGPKSSSAEVRQDVPVQPLRLKADTGLKVLAGNEQGLLMEVKFRRNPAPTELREWTARPGALADGLGTGFADGEKLRFPLFSDTDTPMPLWDAETDKLGLGPLANFCGAYMDNALSEQQETWIELKPGKVSVPSGELVSGEMPAQVRSLPALAKDSRTGWWLETKFHLPFMYVGGFEPPFSEHPMLVLPMARQSSVKQIKAWINGVPLDVRTYRYPRNQSFASFYADLVGSGAYGGDNTLVVYFETGK